MDSKNINSYIFFSFAFLSSFNHSTAQHKQPNILFVIADDQSYSYEELKMTRTPGYDFVCKNGIQFKNAFVTSPGSSPSRASILTGLYPWSIEEAGTHASSFSTKYICFPDLLQNAGYHIGFTGKGWGPGNWKVSGRKQNPAGKEYNAFKTTPPFKGISDIDYAANFNDFLSKKNKNQPFYFWFGAHEPHRGFEKDSWKKTGRQLNDAVLPLFLPSDSIVKGDILDYVTEIEYYDSQLAKVIQLLKENNEFENTIIIVTADNGMAFPHAKANLYESGIHVPLAICWGNKITGETTSNELFSLVNIAPTILDACGIIAPVNSPEQGKSVLNQLTSATTFQGETAIFSGRERHSSARYNNEGYPMRAIRTNKYLLIRNFHPERWPAGNAFMLNENNQLDTTKYIYADIDDSPTKSYLIKNFKNSATDKYYDAAFSKRPEYELFDIIEDPACMINLVDSKIHQQIFENLKKYLNSKLKETNDTRLGVHPEIWEDYPRLQGVIKIFPNIEN